MDRLTPKDAATNGSAYCYLRLAILPIKDEGFRSFLSNCIRLSAAYEDTGLTPEEIASLRTKLEQVEAERDKAVADLKEALTSNSDETLCKYCKNYFECEGEKCPEFISGVGDAEGKYPTWKWSCMDFDYCAMLENTPCHACYDNAYDGFEWRGTVKEEESK